MNKILDCIDNYMNGNDWEDLCVKCYRLRYQKDNYTPIPAVQGGDAGIEGFTQNGIVHQCYCPEREYSDDDLYEHQRNKLTTDIEKLKNNAKRLKELGVPLNTDKRMNSQLFNDILNEFQNKLEKDFSDVFTQASIGELKHM